MFCSNQSSQIIAFLSTPCFLPTGYQLILVTLKSKPRKVKMECNTTEFIIAAGSLYQYLETMQDVRKRRGIRYSLPTILLLIILAKVCGQDTPYGIADWVQHRRELLLDALHLKYSCLPHHSTYRRILESCESEIDRVVSAFLLQLPEVEQHQVISVNHRLR
jgi:hypothetical protein